MKIVSIVTSAVLLADNVQANLRKMKSFTKEENRGMDFKGNVFDVSDHTPSQDLLESDQCAPFIEGIEYGTEQLVSFDIDHVKDWICNPIQMEDIIEFMLSLIQSDTVNEDNAFSLAEDDKVKEKRTFNAGVGVNWVSASTAKPAANPTATPTAKPTVKPRATAGLTELANKAKDTARQVEEVTASSLEFAQEYSSIKAQYHLCMWNCGDLEARKNEAEEQYEEMKTQVVETTERAADALDAVKDAAANINLSDFGRCNTGLKDIMTTTMERSNGKVHNIFSSESVCRESMDKAFSELQDQGAFRQLEIHNKGGHLIKERGLVDVSIIGAIIMALVGALIEALMWPLIFLIAGLFVYCLYLAVTEPFFLWPLF